MKLPGLRVRFAFALVAVAILAVALAAMIGNLGLASRLNQEARARLMDSAVHVADIAAVAYSVTGNWNSSTSAELSHVAALDNLRIAIQRDNGKQIPIGPPPTGATAGAEVIVKGQPVATVVISSAGGGLLSSQEQQLRDSLDQLHLIAAGIAALAALVLGLFLAQTLSKPLRHIRTVAERLEHGELEARVELGNEPGMRAVGRALNRLAETLAHEEELRKEGVADLAHELRTPTNGLLLRIEAAQDRVLPFEENLRAMHTEALRLSHLLDDLSRLTDAERPGMLLRKEPLNLAVVAQGVAESFVPRFDDTNIKFASNCQSAWVLGDANGIEQVISNLLSNALRYTEPGGQVALVVSQSNTDAVLEVSDTGVGIAAENLLHIFTRFWREDPSRSRQTGGSGIGLAIVHELVRAHEGRIDVDSNVGQGSRFRVMFPAIVEQPDVVPKGFQAPDAR